MRGVHFGNKDLKKVGGIMTIYKKLYLSKACNGGPIMPGELPAVRIGYNGLLAFAKKKRVLVIELTEEEKKQSVSHA